MPTTKAKEAEELSHLREKVMWRKVVYGVKKVKQSLKSNVLSKVVVVSNFGNAPDAVSRRGQRLRDPVIREAYRLRVEVVYYSETALQLRQNIGSRTTAIIIGVMD